jgi:hypothetical protein
MSDVQALDARGHIGELCHRYQITSLDGFRESCATFAEEGTPNVAVLGRFKAGKSSFLNHEAIMLLRFPAVAQNPFVPLKDWTSAVMNGDQAALAKLYSIHEII